MDSAVNPRAYYRMWRTWPCVKDWAVRAAVPPQVIYFLLGGGALSGEKTARMVAVLVQDNRE